jgi:hypothetical protein
MTEKLNVGDTLFIVDSISRKTRYYNAVITKVGRIYYDCEFGSRSDRIEITLKKANSVNITAYRSISDYVAHVNKNKAMDVVCHLSHSELEDVAIENILKAAELLGLTVNTVSADDIEVW